MRAAPTLAGLESEARNTGRARKHRARPWDRPWTRPGAASGGRLAQPRTACRAAAGAGRHPVRGREFDRVERDVRRDADLSDNGFRVYAALKGFARQRDFCWPSNEALGRETGGKSPATIKRALRELERRGYVRRVVAVSDPEGRAGHVRHRIELLDPEAETPPPGSDPTHPWVSFDPPPGSDPTPEGEAREREPGSSASPRAERTDADDSRRALREEAPAPPDPAPAVAAPASPSPPSVPCAAPQPPAAPRPPAPLEPPAEAVAAAAALLGGDPDRARSFLAAHGADIVATLGLAAWSVYTLALRRVARVQHRISDLHAYALTAARRHSGVGAVEVDPAAARRAAREAAYQAGIAARQAELQAAAVPDPRPLRDEEVAELQAAARRHDAGAPLARRALAELAGQGDARAQAALAGWEEPSRGPT